MRYQTLFITGILNEVFNILTSLADEYSAVRQIKKLFQQIRIGTFLNGLGLLLDRGVEN